MTADVLPIVQGDWVAHKSDSSRIYLGRVRQSWSDPDGKVYMNVVLFGAEGDVVGRESPHMGGPKTFEPAIEFTYPWQRIEKPSFPLKAREVYRPIHDQPGRVTMHVSYYHDQDDGLTSKTVRIKAKKQSSDYARRPRVVYIEKPAGNLNEELEATALRRSASELRDAARMLDSNSASLLRSRAKSLETQADGIMPRGA